MDSHEPRSATRPSGCGWLFIGAGALFVLILAKDLLHVFDSARTTGQWSATMASAKVIARGFLMYAGDHDQRLPLAVKWEEQVQNYADVSSNVVPKTVGPHGESCRFALNHVAAGLDLEIIENPNAVLIFASRKTQPSSYGGESDFFLDKNKQAYWASISGSARKLGPGSAGKIEWKINQTKVKEN